MRPLNVFKLQADHKMDFVTDCVLDVLSEYEGKTAIHDMVQDCHRIGVASQATTYKKIALLKGLGFVEEVKNPDDDDKRKTFIKVTSKGMDYLRKWER